MQKLNLKSEILNKKNSQDSFIISSIEEVRKRIFEAEKEPSLSQENYNKEMNHFFRNELNIQNHNSKT